MDLETKSFLYFFIACRKRIKSMSKEKLEKYQLKKSQNIVQYATNNSDFFKEYYKKLDSKDVWNLPTVNKKIMMDNLTNYNTVGLKKQELIDFCLRNEETQNYDARFGKYNVAMSSGTSGNKGVVITSPSEERYLRAAFFSRFSFPRTLRLNIAFILRITTPAFQIDKFGQKLTHISQLNTIDEIKNQLKEIQPNVLSAPPSMLEMLADEINEGRLNISPKRVISYAEILYPEIEEKLEQIYGSKIHQIYQASEGSIAMSCKHGSLHINEDLIYVQTLNSDGTPTSPGEPCFKMIITDLHRTAQPIIRYELNDLIITSPHKCECGSSFRVIEQVLGRSDDLFWAQRNDNGEMQFIFPDFIRRAIISSSEEIDEYQAIQKNYSKVVIHIIPETNADKETISKSIEEKIQQVFIKHNCKMPKIEVIFKTKLERDVSQKIIRISRDFDVSF